MVCGRCIMVVKSKLEKFGLKILSIQLGEVEIKDNITKTQKDTLAKQLFSLGFVLIDDKKSKTIEKIKNLIIELVHFKNNEISSNLSTYLSDHLLQDYNTLSNLFSEVEGSTIEHYFIAQKIEKAKELLIYNELTLTEIAFQLNYSSVAYLSSQFKKVTGFTPTHFKQLQNKKRIQIDDL
jgi:YesN/AraC family two-component response regulator